MFKVYEYTRQPPHWVVHDDDGYWLVPVRAGGWNDRVPYVGHTAALRELQDWHARAAELELPLS